MKERYRPRRAFCLKTGVNTDIDVVNPEDLIARKRSSTDILFIGRGAYQRGVDILIKAFELFNTRRHDAFTLHIVGVQPEELPQELRAPSPLVKLHGYLDKSSPAELQRYNDLLRSAKLFVMPMRPGPFPGVIREVQLHCTPVIASNVSNGSEHLTHEHDGILVDSLEPEKFADHLERLVDDTVLWRRLAMNGHVRRRGQTWCQTVENFLDIVRECNLIAPRPTLR